MVVFTKTQLLDKPTFQQLLARETLTVSNPTAGDIDAFVYDNPDDIFEVQTAGTITLKQYVGTRC